MCVSPPIPQLWRATLSLLLLGVSLNHLLCVDVRFDAALDLDCKRVVSRSCATDASPGAAELGFMASIAAACSGPMSATH